MSTAPAAVARVARPRRIGGWTWFLLILSTLLLAVGSCARRAERGLRSRGETARATVVDWRQHHGRGGVTWEVRYRFQVPGDPKVYSVSDDGFPLWREELWVAISREAWEQTRRSRTIDVRYLPESPGTNRPSGSARDGTDGGTLVIVGLLGYVLALLVEWKARQDAWPSPPAPPTGPGKLLGRFERIRPRGGGRG